MNREGPATEQPIRSRATSNSRFSHISLSHMRRGKVIGVGVHIYIYDRIRENLNVLKQKIFYGLHFACQIFVVGYLFIL